jgi:hypothetical protein
MDSEELREDRAHDLLATAFGDDAPVVDLVPAAVEGLRRHRRPTRLLGTAGGALALTGAVVAGATMGLANGPATQSAAGGGNKCEVPESVVKQAGWDAAMVRTVTQNCETNIKLIEHAIPGSRVEPSTPKFVVVVVVQLSNHTPSPTFKPGPTSKPGPRDYPVIAYDITVHGRTTTLSLLAAKSGYSKMCGSYCLHDTTLFGGMLAQQYSGPEGDAAKSQIDEVAAYPEAMRTLFASIGYGPGAPRAFDFEAFSHSADFAELVTGSTDLLIGMKYNGIGPVPVR